MSKWFGLSLVSALVILAGVVTPGVASADDPPMSATFVRSTKDCNVGTLTFYGIKPSKRSLVTLVWGLKPGSPYSKAFDYEGRGGDGVNWRHTFNVEKNHGLTFPKGSFRLGVQYSRELAPGGMQEGVFNTTIGVPACRA